MVKLHLDDAKRIASTHIPGRWDLVDRLLLKIQRSVEMQFLAAEALANADADIVMLGDAEATCRRASELRASLDTMLIPARSQATAAKALDAVLGGKESDAGAGREAVSRAVRSVGLAAAQTEKRWQDFNGRLFGIGLWLSGSMFVLGIVTLIWTWFVPLCAPNAGSNDHWCTGGTTPRGGVVAVMVMGALGGLMAATTALSRRTSSPVPSYVRATESGLRVPLGALIAVLGVLLLQSGLAKNAVSQFTPATSPEAVLIWAVAFGVASLLVAKLVDRRLARVAEEVGGTTPTTSPQPEPQRAEV